MELYLSRVGTIASICRDFSIPMTEVAHLFTDRLRTVAEYITVRTGVRRVEREPEADRMLSMSRAPRILHESVETLRINANEIDCEFEDEYVQDTNIDHDNFLPSSMVRNTMSICDHNR